MEMTIDVLDPTAPPVQAVGAETAIRAEAGVSDWYGSDPTAPPPLLGDPAPVPAGPPSADDAVRLVYDQDRPCALVLSPDWKSVVPPSTLGMTLTAQLARHHVDTIASFEPREARMLAHSTMPITVAHELQERLATLQDELLAGLPGVLEAPGEKVTSTHHTVTATVVSGRVVGIEVDPSWVESTTSMAIIDAVGDTLRRARSLVAGGDGDGRDDPLGTMRRELADISTELDDWARG